MWPKIGPLSTYGILYLTGIVLHFVLRWQIAKRTGLLSLTQLLCVCAAIVALWVLVSWSRRPAGSAALDNDGILAR